MMRATAGRTFAAGAPAAGKNSRAACVCHATTKRAGGKGSGSASTTPAAGSMAVGEPAFQEVDSAFGAIKDWNGELADFKMETDLSKVCDKEELAGARKRFEELLSEYEYKFDPGERVTGLVLSVGKKGATVEIGAKLPAFCPAYETMARPGANLKSVFTPGLEREFEVVDTNRRGESIFISAKAVDSDIVWKRLVQLSEQNAAVDVEVTRITRGGAIVQLEGLQGFVPKSHLSMDAEKAKSMVGKKIICKFLEADRDNARLVFSHKLATAQSSVDILEVGAVVKGKVVAVKDYGAFVDLGLEFNALLHVSQVSYNRLFTVDQVLSVGDEIKAMVLSFDAARGRVSLSTKKLEMEPGDMLRNPSKVFDNAEKMAEQFKERVAQAEAVARASANAAAAAAPEEKSE